MGHLRAIDDQEPACWMIVSAMVVFLLQLCLW